MAGFPFEHDAPPILFDAIDEGQPCPPQVAEPKPDGEQIVVAGWRQETQGTLDDREHQPVLLAAEERFTQLPEELAPRRLEHGQIPAIVDMVAQRALGIRDPVEVAKFRRNHAAEVKDHPARGRGRCRVNSRFEASAPAVSLRRMTDHLVINEIYLSLQGESTLAGLPCVFVRLTGCNLRCSYCDTAYAFTDGRRWAPAEVLGEVRRLAAPYRTVPTTVALPLVELTGGEPLLQPAVLPLMQALCDEGFTVLLETSGALEIAPVEARVRRIMDLKCPSSGEGARNRWENLDHLRATDEVKFVIATEADYHWARQVISERGLAQVCPLLFSWASPLESHQRHPSLKPVAPGQTPISRRALAEQIVADALPVRFQAQWHKIIWPADRRGV